MKNLSLCFLLLSSFILTAQKNDFSIELDGIDDMITILNSAVIDSIGNSDFSYHMWFKKKSTDIVTKPSEYLIDRDSNSAGFWSRLEADGKVRSIIDEGSNADQIYSNASFYDDKWHYLAVAVDFSNASYKVYIDSILNDSVAITINTSKINVHDNLNIGGVESNGTKARLFKGKLDDIAFWNKALTEAEIRQYMKCPPTGAEIDLIGYWNFDQGTSTTIADQSLSNNTSVVYGNPSWSADAPVYKCGKDTVVKPNSVSNDRFNSTIDVFPNPSNGLITIQISHETIGEIFIIDLLGNVVSQKKFDTKEVQMNLTGLCSTGIYFTKVIDAQGSVFAITKLVIE